MQTLKAPDTPAAPPREMPPLVLTRIACPHGELNFMSTFTTFVGAGHDLPGAGIGRYQVLDAQ